MKSLDNLSDRIWSEVGRRRRVHVRVLTGVLTVTVIGVVGAFTLWPKPALAFQEMKEATLAFKTVRWTQRDAGVIRDMGSDNPKRVPYFVYNREHFVSRDPIAIWAKWDGWNEWRGQQAKIEPHEVTENGKNVVKNLRTFRFKPDASVGISERDLEFALAHFGDFDNLRLAFSRGQTNFTSQPNQQYSGMSVTAYELRYTSGPTSSVVTIYADEASNRMVFYQLEKFDADKSRLIVRTISDIAYDGPPPK